MRSYYFIRLTLQLFSDTIKNKPNSELLRHLKQFNFDQLEATTWGILLLNQNHENKLMVLAKQAINSNSFALHVLRTGT